MKAEELLKMIKSREEDIREQENKIMAIVEENTVIAEEYSKYVI